MYWYMFSVGLPRCFDSSAGVISKGGRGGVRLRSSGREHTDERENDLENDTCIGVETSGKITLKHGYIRRTTK